MQITVGILTYNSSETIIACLKSLEKQTYKNFRVIIVDDHSTDNTLSLIKKHTFSFPIDVHHNGAHNISIGRNIAITHSTTPYLAYLDSDAYADDKWLERIYKNFTTNKKLAVLGGTEVIVHTNTFSKAIAMNDQAINGISNDIWKTKGANFAINLHLLKNVYFNKKFIHNDETEFIFRVIKTHQYLFDNQVIVNHQARSSMKRYIKQVSKYGIWRVFFSYYSNKFRAIDFIPSLLILLSILLAFFNPFFMFSVFLFSLLETGYITIKAKPTLTIIPYLYMGWLIKNFGWGIGVIVGLTKVALNRNLITNLAYKESENSL